MVEQQTAVAQIERHEKLEKIFAAATLERDVYHREQELKIRWPENLPLAAEIAIRLQTPGGRIYGELQPFFVRPGAVANLGKVYRVPDGAYHVVLMPRLEEYYEQGLKIQRRISLSIANGPFRSTPYGTLEQRRQEALDDAARRNLGLFSEIAKMILGRWEQVKPAVIEQAMGAVNEGAADSEQMRLGLLGMATRFGADPQFPASLLAPLAATIRNVPDPTESSSLLGHVCLLMAGQLYPDHSFGNSGQSGVARQAQGEAGALAWLRQQTHGALPAWTSGRELANMVLALTHLVDWAANTQVAELAAVLLDKLCFTLAVNSYQGVYGLVGQQARLDATTSLAHLLWGMGALNDQIIGPVSLAGSGYELPPIIAQIAVDQPAALVNREQHGGVSRLAYKTPDYLLCSLQDYQPDAVGDQPVVWQATLGSEAVVLATLPARVAQWQDGLVAIYQLSATSDLTRVYFPTHAFDEYTVRDGWAFARQGNGYLALRTSSELQLVTTGKRAGRELRATGAEQSWLLQMGRAAQDGSFAEFQTKILDLAITLAPQSLHATTLRGETLTFGWNEPLRVNGVEQPTRGFKHYDNPYCVTELGAEQMTIQFGDELMRLDFS